MTILITGGAGYIGSNLAKSLEEKTQEHIVLVDNFSRGKESYLKYLGVKAPCLNGDLRCYETARVFMKNVDTVFHTASRIGGEQFLHGSPEKEFQAFDENIKIDNNIIRAAFECGIKKIIYTSSVSVYNTKQQYDKTDAYFEEEDLDFDNLPLNNVDPESGYGLNKFVTEYNMKYLREKGINTGIARIFKSYGPCDDYSPESGQVVCSLMRKAINYPKEPFVVWGSGMNMRNLVYIDDLVDALIKLYHYLDTKSLTVNLGGKEPLTIQTIANEIIKISGKEIKPEFDVSKKGGPKSRIPILQRAKKELNWEPTTPLEIGLKKTYDWMLHEIQ